MKNHNSLGRKLGISGAAATLCGAAIFGGLELGGAFDSHNNRPAPAATDGVGGARNPIPNPSAPRIDCFGLISEVVKVTNGYGGDYMVNGTRGGACVTVYNPNTYQDSGELTNPDGDFDACTIPGQPNKLHVRFHADATSMIEGDANLTADATLPPDIQTCAAAGMDPNFGSTLSAAAPSN